jgi:hypothetical protein
MLIRNSCLIAIFTLAMLGCTSVNKSTYKTIADNAGMIELTSEWDSGRRMWIISSGTDLKPLFYSSYDIPNNLNSSYFDSTDLGSGPSRYRKEYGPLYPLRECCTIRVLVNTDMSVGKVMYLTGNKRLFNSSKKNHSSAKYEITSNPIPGPWELDFLIIAINGNGRGQSLPISYRTAVDSAG